MKMRLILYMIAINAIAQSPQAEPARGTIRGVVRDSVTGDPVADFFLRAFRGSNTLAMTRADSQGRFAFTDLVSGSVRISARDARTNQSTDKFVDLPPGQEIEVDIRVPARTLISGRVIDQDSEPVPNLDVILVARDYAYGQLRYVVAGIGGTNDAGDYSMRFAQPRRAYFLLVRHREGNIEAISQAPADPKSRKPAVMPTYYPGTDSFQGAELISLRPGEQREHVDIRITRMPSFCVEGVVSNGQSQSFQLTEHEPALGEFEGAFFDVGKYSGKTTGNGEIRICDLHPGTYDLKVWHTEGTVNTSYAVAPVSITDRDFPISIAGLPQISIAGEIVWGDGKTDPLGTKVNLDIMPLEGGHNKSQVDVPGKFSFDHMVMREYSVALPDNLPAGVYVKDITYAGNSILHDTLRPGTAVGASELRITLARDGGNIGVTVADKDGKTIPDINVALMPDGVLTEAGLAAATVTGKTSQNGTWNSPSLGPGKYFAIASRLPTDKSPEAIARLADAKSKVMSIDLVAGQSLQITILSD
jgi:hypothetical protein